MAAPQKATHREVVEQVLPLVLELIPGQAGEGLIGIHEPGSYEALSLRTLCEKLLKRTNWSVEEQQVLEDIRRQLAGGRLLCRGRSVDGTALDHAVVEETEAGERYLYVPVRAIKPQEGGSEEGLQETMSSRFVITESTTVEDIVAAGRPDPLYCRRGLAEKARALADQIDAALGGDTSCGGAGFGYVPDVVEVEE
jgi:hypothetical protein